MKKLLKNLVSTSFLIAGLLSCSTSSNKKIKSGGDRPDWVYSPTKACSSFELCATGEGGSLIDSDASAKSALASIFSIQVSSQFNLSKFNYSKGSISEMEEKVSEDINTSVDEILKGVYIKERYEKDNHFFSHSALDKRKTGRILQQQIRSLDKELHSVMKKSNRILVKRANILFLQRESLNEKLIVIDGKGIKSRYNLERINNLKDDPSRPNKVAVDFDDNIPDFLLKKIKEVLSDIGYQFVKRDDADYRVQFRFKYLEEYMNVKGFSKYSFELSIKANTKYRKVGNFIVKHTQTGRNYQQALFKAKAKIITEFENNIQKLKMD